jgi:chromosome segregation ATPase
MFASHGPAGFGGTGNAAFEEYRRNELRRLDEERRKLDEEARAFRDFVEELKRAKDREEFDAFMAKRRADTGGSTGV